MLTMMPMGYPCLLQKTPECLQVQARERQRNGTPESKLSGVCDLLGVTAPTSRLLSRKPRKTRCEEEMLHQSVSNAGRDKMSSQMV